MKAKRGGYCGRCGAWAAAGNDLERVYDAIEDEDVWVVYHTDRSICERNIAEAKAREMARDAFRGALRALESRFLVEGTLPDQRGLGYSFGSAASAAKNMLKSSSTAARGRDRAIPARQLFRLQSSPSMPLAWTYQTVCSSRWKRMPAP